MNASGLGTLEEACNGAALALAVVALAVACGGGGAAELVDAADTDAGAGTLEAGCRDETRVLAMLSSLPLPYDAPADADTDPTSFIVTSTASTFGSIGLRVWFPFLGPSGIDPYARIARGALAEGGVRALPRGTGERERELRPYARTAAAAAYSRSRLIDRRPRRRCASRGDAASTARSRLSVRRRATLVLDAAAGDRSRLRPGLIERWRAPLAMCGWWWVW